MFFNLLTVTTLLAVFVSGVTTAVPPDCTRFYTFKARDTYDRIATKSMGFKVNLLAYVNLGIRVHPKYSYQLDLINGLRDGCTDLVPGTKLCLARKGHDCKDLHVVVPGDTCWKLAPKGDIKLLQANNGNLGKDCQFIRIGEVLCVADHHIYTS